MSQQAKKQVFSKDEVARHSTRDDCWIIISGKVYDVTNWLDTHPGGPEVLLENAGRDATKAFTDVGHSESAIQLKSKYCIGDLSCCECTTRAKCIGTVAAVAAVAAIAVGVWWWRNRK